MLNANVSVLDDKANISSRAIGEITPSSQPELVRNAVQALLDPRKSALMNFIQENAKRQIQTINTIVNTFTRVSYEEAISLFTEYSESKELLGIRELPKIFQEMDINLDK